MTRREEFTRSRCCYHAPAPILRTKYPSIAILTAMPHSVLVTGGAGFIGSHVVRAFASNGSSVTVLDDLSSGKLANLLEAVRQSGKKSTRFIFSSTGGALYGDVEMLPTPESFPKDPQSPYGNAKLSVELYLGYYARVHGLDTVALRYGNVYGPRQDSHGEAGVVAIFCERVIEGRKLTVFGDGSQTRDYVYAEDVANANYLAATKPLPLPGPLDSRSFNIGTGVETSVSELAAMLGEVSGIPTPTEHAPPRPGEVKRSCLLPDKAEIILGWRPSTGLREGVKETFEWFRSAQVQRN